MFIFGGKTIDILCLVTKIDWTLSGNKNDSPFLEEEKRSKIEEYLTERGIDITSENYEINRKKGEKELNLCQLRVSEKKLSVTLKYMF